MSIAEKKWLTNYEVVKALGIVLIAASAWFRLEYKIDRATDNVLKKIDEHVAVDKEQKDRFNEQISELRQAITQIQSDAKEYLKNEYLRPEEPTIKRRRE